MIKRALNQKTSPHLSYEEFLDLAKALGSLETILVEDCSMAFLLAKRERWHASGV